MKTSGIMLKKQVETYKPDVVKIDPNMKVEKREAYIASGSLNNTDTDFLAEDDGELAEQLEGDDPFANLDARGEEVTEQFD